MELNEADLIEHEVTIRNLRFTKEVAETRRSLIRWLALSLGVINPGESRLSALAVLDSMLHFQFNQKKDPNVEEILEYINSAWGDPMNEKTLRYHLLQLSKAKIVDHSKGKYYLVHPQVGREYDEEEWVNHYFSMEIAPIKEKLIAAMKELRNK